MRVTHQWDENRAIIRVEGLTKNVKAMQMGDLHMGIIDERDPDRLDAFAGSAERFHHRHDNKDDAGNAIPQETAFAQMLDVAGQERVDLLCLTGDIVDFPAIANVEYAGRLIAESDIPSVFTSGNHDWLFSDSDPTAAVRRAYWPQLDPLTGGEPAFSRRQVGGMLFVAVDNSIYQVEEDQLESTRQALAEGLPTVLLIHIPISLPTLRPAVIEMWGHSIVMADPDWPLENRQENLVDDATPATLEFVRMVSRAENLVAVLAGHCHIPHIDAISPAAAQYLAPPGYAGQYRLFEWQPL